MTLPEVHTNFVHEFLGVIDLPSRSVERLRQFEPPEGYYLCFSGGKDSIVLYDIAVKSGVKFDAHYSVTGIDPPELVRFIKRNYPAVAFEHAEKTMWKLIVEKVMPPTRIVRYCCEHLKERGGDGRRILTGIRWAESSRRKKRMMFERYKTVNKEILNPIIDWSDADVWQYIKDNGLEYCELYDQGYKRLGCIGCPMSSNQLKELNAYPRYKNLYLRAFGRMIDNRHRKGLKCAWKTPQEVMNWWTANRKRKIDDCQGVFF